MSCRPPFAPRRGRPRDEARERAILEAARSLLVEVGYERMSMAAVAFRARASKATIYRRWPGKADLVVAVLGRQVDPAFEPADGGSLRVDLLDLFGHFRDAVAPDDAALLVGVLAAARTSPDLARAMQTHFVEDKRRVSEVVVGRAVARGEIRPGASVDTFQAVTRAMVFDRLLVTGGLLDDEFIRYLIDDVLVPLLSHVPPSTGRPDPAAQRLPSGAPGKEMP